MASQPRARPAPSCGRSPTASSSSQFRHNSHRFVATDICATDLRLHYSMRVGRSPSANERSERATRTEGAGEPASERAWPGGPGGDAPRTDDGHSACEVAAVSHNHDMVSAMGAFAAVLVLLPALLRWVWARGSTRDLNDPALPERLFA